MANRDLLKEAIADAKAVKETAIANAKAALEEAFAPRMQELLKAKLAEMDDEDIKEAEEMKEEEIEETYEVEEADDAEGYEGQMGKKDLGVKEADDDEMDLEELLRELDELEEDDSVMEGEDLINDPKTETAHGNVAEADEEEADEEEGEEEEGEEEEIDLENMDEDDLKKFIEDVIADMVEAGELEAGEGAEGEEEGEEEEGEEEEIMERQKYGGNKGDEKRDDMKKKKEGHGRGPKKKDSAESEGEIDYKRKMKENQEPVNEIVGAALLAGAILALIGGTGYAMASAEEKKEMKAEMEKIAAENPNMSEKELKAKAMEIVKKRGEGAYGKGTLAKGTAGSAFGESMEAELEEAYNTIRTIKEELAEVNLFNAKLLYTNKIFKSKNLTEGQKVKVLAAFDKAASVKEAKLVFETLNEGFKSKKAPVNESLIHGGASKVAGVAAKKPIMEANDQVARWQKLAGIK
jgi:hypothetical protein